MAAVCAEEEEEEEEDEDEGAGAPATTVSPPTPVLPPVLPAADAAVFAFAVGSALFPSLRYDGKTRKERERERELYHLGKNLRICTKKNTPYRWLVAGWAGGVVSLVLELYVGTIH
jgi:hypothetical protein